MPEWMCTAVWIVLIVASGLLAVSFAAQLPAILADLRAVRRDPAAEGWLAALMYPGFHALTIHRVIAHPLYRLRMRTLARLFNFLARFLTGADIHPGATLGRGIFIDHAHGVVIGETAVVGNNVTILHEVTLGGTGKETGKRHPTIEDGVLIGAGAKILGNIIVGRNAKVGAGSVVVNHVCPEATVVGVPGKIVSVAGRATPSFALDQTTLPDPTIRKILALEEEIRSLQAAYAEMSGRGDMLGRILVHKRAEVARLKKERPLDWMPASAAASGAAFETSSVPSPIRRDARSFREALRRKDGRVALIAEFKRMSPSGGPMREDGLGPREAAVIYERSGAAALSVLTDSRFFGGSLEDLAEARAAVSLPILRKDFTIDPYQIAEAARAGADAVLLIASCLSDFELAEFIKLAAMHGMDALVETHDEADLERALVAGASVIGINNRDLRTLRIDIQTTARLAARIPPSAREKIVLVSESGLRSASDISFVACAGVDAVLIGEAFLKAPDIAAKVAEIMSSRA